MGYGTGKLELKEQGALLDLLRQCGSIADPHTIPIIHIRSLLLSGLSETRDVTHKTMNTIWEIRGLLLKLAHHQSLLGCVGIAEDVLGRVSEVLH